MLQRLTGVSLYGHGLRRTAAAASWHLGQTELGTRGRLAHVCDAERHRATFARSYVAHATTKVEKDNEAVIPKGPACQLGMKDWFKKQREEEGANAAVEEHEVADPALIFNNVWNKLEQKHGAEKMQFPEEAIFFMGAPGSGKGTHAPFIQKVRSLSSSAVAISDLLNSPEAAAMKSRAELVCDGTVLELLFEELLKPEYENGVIIDGFPRTHKQVAFIKLLHAKMTEQHRRFLHTDLNVKFTRPRFRMAVLFISEQTSIARQLSRGERAKAHNLEVEATGQGELLELRETDLSEDAARKRYQIFTEHYDTLFDLRETFAFKLVNADTTIEEVQKNLLEEFEYQGSLELGEDTFELLSALPLANDVRMHARQNLIARLDLTQQTEPEHFKQVVDLIAKDFMPIISVHALSGYCIVRSQSPIVATPQGRAMAMDILTERGFHVTLDVRKDRVLETVEKMDDKYKPIYNVRKTHVFHIKHPKVNLRTFK